MIFSFESPTLNYVEISTYCKGDLTDLYILLKKIVFEAVLRVEFTGHLDYPSSA